MRGFGTRSARGVRARRVRLLPLRAATRLLLVDERLQHRDLFFERAHALRLRLDALVHMPQVFRPLLARTAGRVAVALLADFEARARFGGGARVADGAAEVVRDGARHLSGGGAREEACGQRGVFRWVGWGE